MDSAASPWNRAQQRRVRGDQRGGPAPGAGAPGHDDVDSPVRAAAGPGRVAARRAGPPGPGRPGRAAARRLAVGRQPVRGGGWRMHWWRRRSRRRVAGGRQRAGAAGMSAAGSRVAPVGAGPGRCRRPGRAVTPTRSRAGPRRRGCSRAASISSASSVSASATAASWRQLQQRQDRARGPVDDERRLVAAGRAQARARSGSGRRPAGPRRPAAGAATAAA